MTDKLYFRPGVGAVIYNVSGDILVFERADLPGLWQCMQGGMDIGETYEDTLWRELEEETGLRPDDIDQVTAYPKWTLYEFSAEMKARTTMKNCLGQVHRWFFLRLKADTTVDLSRATHEEFSNFQFMTFPHFLTVAASAKLAMYEELYDYFKTQNIPDQG